MGLSLNHGCACSATAVSVVTDCLAWQVAAHVQTLPFHAHSFNLLRGGVYMVVLWAAFASAILSANGRVRIRRRRGLHAERTHCQGLYWFSPVSPSTVRWDCQMGLC